MTKKLLTDRAVMNLKPPRNGQRFIVQDIAVPGLAVRITPNGHRAYILGARFPGCKHFVRRVIGEVGVISLAAAREQARTWLVEIKSGIDPAKKASTPQLEINNSFEHVASAFITRHLANQRKGARVAREIRNELIPRWGQLPIAKISRQMVVELIEAIVDRPAPRHAHTIYGHVRTLYNWAIARGIYNLESSPCDRLRPVAFIGPKRVRERVLNDDELVRLWQATDHYPYGALTRLLLLTGARLNMIARASWSEADFARRTLTVPAERFKAGSQHTIPLSDDAIALLQDLPRRGQFLFTSSGVRPIGDFYSAKLKLDHAMGDVAPWCFHDLRRTFRTRLAELKIQDTVAELAIGHAKKGLRRVYDQHAYADEIRAAMETWAARLRSIVAPEPDTNVIRAAFRTQ
jgi:integrase